MAAQGPAEQEEREGRGEEAGQPPWRDRRAVSHWPVSAAASGLDQGCWRGASGWGTGGHIMAQPHRSSEGTRGA